MISVQHVSKQYTRGPEGGRSFHGGLTALARLVRHQKPDPASGGQDEFWALDDVSFDIHYGERVGLIGRNGAGKSTLLKILSRIVYPTHGEARIKGRLVSLLEVGTGFNGDLTGRENVYLNGSIHGLTRAEIAERFEDIVEFSGVRSFLDTPVKRYSSGMQMRLAFAVAVHLDPDILLLDEVLTVGDLEFQQKCLDRVEDLVAEGRTLLFVSHSVEALAMFCDRCIWLEEGRVRMDGPTAQVLREYAGEDALDLQVEALARLEDDEEDGDKTAEDPEDDFAIWLQDEESAPTATAAPAPSPTGWCDGVRIATVSPPAPQAAGATVTATATAQAHQDAVPEYLFLLKDPERGWSIVRDWSTDPSYTYAPLGERPGEYLLGVWVRAVGVNPDAWDATNTAAEPYTLTT